MITLKEGTFGNFTGIPLAQFLFSQFNSVYQIRSKVTRKRLIGPRSHGRGVELKSSRTTRMAKLVRWSQLQTTMSPMTFESLHPAADQSPPFSLASKSQKTQEMLFPLSSDVSVPPT